MSSYEQRKDAVAKAEKTKALPADLSPEKVAARNAAVGDVLGAATSPLWAFAAGRGGKMINGLAPSAVMLFATLVAVYGFLTV